MTELQEADTDYDNCKRASKSLSEILI